MESFTYPYYNYSIHEKQLNLTFPTFLLLIFSVSEPLLVITSELELTVYVPKNLWFTIHDRLLSFIKHLTGPWSSYMDSKPHRD